MKNLKNILRCYAMGMGLKSISTAFEVSRNTVRKYVRRYHDAKERAILIEIIEDRHERKSIIISSQLPVSSWYDAIGDPTAADAILDRIVHTAHQIELSGESLRKIKARKGDK